MKTAIIYTGQARSFLQVLPNQYWHVLRKFPNPAFFVSVTDDPEADDMMKLKEKFPHADFYFEKVAQPHIPEPAPDPLYLTLYPPSSPPQAILRQFWALNRGWEFFRESCKWTDFNVIVRIRPDIAFTRFEMPEDFFNGSFTKACYTPWFARWGGIMDRFAVMGYGAARAYFTTYTRLNQLLAQGCPLHPETALAASLEQEGIRPKQTLATETVTVRMDGTVIPINATSIDLAEFSRT